MNAEELKENNRALYESSLMHRVIPNVLGGGVAGLVTDFFIFPIETIKTRFQASRQFVTSPFFQKTFQGIRAQLIMSCPNTALYFTGYECTKYFLDQESVPYKFSMTSKAILGGIVAEFFQMIFSNPFEIVKQQIQVGQETYMLQAFKNNINSNGFKGLYRGWTSMLGREIPYSCIQFSIYEVRY